jgi:hypothetical protein
MLQHWTDYFVALRRAPAPAPAPALAGTAAAAALLRLTSLAEILLIGLLYFKGTSGTSGAFYTGLALWALLVVAPAVQPLWHWLGFIHAEPSSKVRRRVRLLNIYVLVLAPRCSANTHGDECRSTSGCDACVRAPVICTG